MKNQSVKVVPSNPSDPWKYVFVCHEVVSSWCLPASLPASLPARRHQPARSFTGCMKSSSPPRSPMIVSVLSSLKSYSRREETTSNPPKSRIASMTVQYSHFPPSQSPIHLHGPTHVQSVSCLFLFSHTQNCSWPVLVVGRLHLCPVRGWSLFMARLLQPKAWYPCRRSLTSSGFRLEFSLLPLAWRLC
jgi:hypothetical protein